ncbi:16105_t:CDS:2 [Acaulospora colombiana]|uniref:16105_t:CDS:1 n=1 Tax=Acaulospora colombiana TaxID=27376 RepID=A0ACA9QMR1_9GLOM|nr:16105_t:CDS:2 [Acaulospora colombiana]
MSPQLLVILSTPKRAKSAYHMSIERSFSVLEPTLLDTMRLRTKTKPTLNLTTMTRALGDPWERCRTAASVQSSRSLTPFLSRNEEKKTKVVYCPTHNSTTESRERITEQNGRATAERGLLWGSVDTPKCQRMRWHDFSGSRETRATVLVMEEDQRFSKVP